jgi:hypothetical protein
MSKLVIGVARQFESSYSGPGALLNIIPIANVDGSALDAQEHGSRRQEDVIVPVGDRGETREVDLPAGRYLARVRMPSGEIIDTPFAAVKDEPVHLQINPTPSKHEWLSWQQLSGNIIRRPSVQLRERTITPTPLGAPKAKSAYAQVARTDLRQAFTALDVGSAAQGTFGNGKLWDALLRAKEDLPDAWQRFGNPAGPACWSGELQAIDREDEEFRLLRTSRADARWENRTQDSWRHYFVLRSDEAIEIASVPLGWRFTGPSSSSRIEVLTRKRAAPGAFLSRVTITDEQTSAMLCYMAQGRPDLARPFVELARGLLLEKIDNPLGAAAGGYVLLANASAAGDSGWQNWTGNLMSMAPWLPDGAILHGIRKLRMGTDDDDFRQAGRTLLDAFRRGPPVFSMGIPLLQEGLMQIAHQWQEEETKAALKTVNTIAAHMDTAQPFLTLRFRRAA